jgi:hypothetical protein
MRNHRMLVHIRPKLFSPFKNVVLLNMEFDFGLHLAGGSDLRTGRPYPNKWYAVGCRKIGRKAVDGILLELPFREMFSCTAHWVIEAELVVTHQVDYTIIDRDFDAVSDDMVLWYACAAGLGGWSSRFPNGCDRAVPVVSEPMMEVVAGRVDKRRRCDDIVKGGLIASRRECFAMPTIERERILNTKLHQRIPTEDMVLRVG